MEGEHHEEGLSQQLVEDQYAQPVPLKKSKVNQQGDQQLKDESQVNRSQSLTQGYEMDKEMSQTLSADTLAVPPAPPSMGTVEGENDGGGNGNTDTNIIEDEMGGSFVKAVHSKYCDIGQLKHCFLGGLVVPKCSAVKVTESGNILLPNQVSMSGCEISVAGSEDLIRRMCQNVTHLDLMANEIKHWEEVITILECTPTLTFLNLSKNHIDSALPDLSGRSLPCLTHLVLNGTNTRWSALLSLLQVCPQVEELHLSLNKFTSVDIPEDQTPCPSVRKLFFIGNYVTDWREINKLGRFLPGLQSLMLCETDISCLGCCEELGPSFPSLEILSLNRSCLASWEELEKLNEFPRLSDIRLLNIPFFESLPTKARRQRQIAMLPKLSMLNKSPISEDEREDAERSYIRLYMDEEEQPPRYHELVSKHGSLEPLAKVDLSPKDTVRVQIIMDVSDENEEGWKINTTTTTTNTITIINDNECSNRDDNGNDEHDEEEEDTENRQQQQQQTPRGETMDIDVHCTAKTLRKMISNMTGCPASKLQLFHNDKGCNQGPVRMTYPDRKILAYRVNDGDDIVVIKRP